MTIYGWDASDFDWDRGPMDVAAAARDGIAFLTHKLTEGRGNRHIHAGTVLARGRDAGIPFLGGYHVVHTTDVPGQVAYLLAYADRVVPWWRTYPGWFWQADAERWDTDFPPVSAVKTFCDLLAVRTGKTVICYASKGQYGETLRGLGRPLWNANYGSDRAGHYRQLYPGDTSPGWGAYSGQTPVLLQYGDRLTIGSQPGCDANAFRGSVEQLRALIQGGDVATQTDAYAANADAAAWAWLQLLDRYDVPFPGDNPAAGPARGFPTPAVAMLKRIDMATAADLAEDKAARVALDGLTKVVTDLASALAGAGGNADLTWLSQRLDGLTAAVAKVGADESAAVGALQQQVADLTRKLAAAGHSLDS